MKVKTSNHISTLVKQLPTPTAFLDSNFMLLYASHSWLEHFNCTRNQYFGRCIRHLPQFSESQVVAQLKFCLEGQPQKLIFKGTYQDDQYRNYQFHCTPWYNDYENIIGIIIQAEDITRHLENEVRFEKLENLIKDQSELSKVGTWEYDVLSQRLVWSEMTKRIHEVPEDFQPDVDTAIDFYINGHERNTIAMLIHNGITKGQSWKIKSKIKTHKGKEKWVVTTGKPLHENNGVIRLVGTFQDITEKELAAQQIQEREQLLHTLIDNIPLNIYIKDLNSRKILVNKAECDFLGVPNAKQILGKCDHDLYDNETANQLREEDLEVIASNKPILSKEQLITKKGKQVPMLISKIPLKNLMGEVNAILGIGMDISTLKEKENELRSLINVTAKQNKKLLDFAHIISHDLRSHTANFSMLLEFLVQEQNESEKENIIKMLYKASDRLMETLENLNAVVAINTNANIEQESLDLHEKARGITKNLKNYIEKKEALVINKIRKGTMVKATPSYLENIIQSMITNAIKYSHPNRSPKIVLEAKKQENGTLFSITDNGLGIDLEKYGDKLFGMYKTFHNNTSRGIGLYLVKNQIEAMGGSITVHSKVGKGSIFNIVLDD